MIYDSEEHYELDQEMKILQSKYEETIKALKFIKLNLINELDEPAMLSFWRATDTLKILGEENTESIADS